MKRMIAVLLSVMILAGVLTACSGTAYYDDGYGYGNVSTTPNGTVNGTNGYGAGGYGSNGYGANGAGYANGRSGYGTNGTGYANGTSGVIGNSGTTNGNGTGTGMTGGR